MSKHLFVAPTEFSEAAMTETTKLHKLLTKGSNFAAISDSIVVVIDQLEVTSPEVSKDSTPPLFPLNPSSPDTPTEMVGSSIEKKPTFNLSLFAPQQPDPPNTNFLISRSVRHH